MNQFIFDSRQKSVLLGFIGLGLVSMVGTWFSSSDDVLHTRFWTNFLHNAYFFSGIALMALFFYCVKQVAYGGWSSVFKRVWEAMFLNLGVFLGIMAIFACGVFFEWHHIYHWNDAAAVATDKILLGKAAFLNKSWYAFGVLGFMFAWYLMALKMRSLSLNQDETTPDKHYVLYVRTIMKWAAIILPVIGFSSAIFVWLAMMSVDAHWFSTMFAWYNGASWMVSMLCMTILLLIYLKDKGYYKDVTADHFHDLGKFLFGLSVFWMYLCFDQYMLIWYANIGEETTYYATRLYDYPITFWANMLLNFVLPFLVMIRNDNKRKMGTMAIVCILVFFGHWLDFFQMAKYGPLETANEHIEHMSHGSTGAHDAKTTTHNVAAGAHAGPAHTDAHVADAHGAHTVAAIEPHRGSNSEPGRIGEKAPFKVGYSIPGFLEIGTFLGFLALFIFFVFRHLSQAIMVPKNDPYLEESLNHHVI
jgi:hypothetical protein